MSQHVKGSFTVQLAPLALSEIAQPSGLGRMSLDKRYEGPLTATSRGEMLTGMGSQSGSAGYVAMEKVTGTLDGLEGSFLLQHSGSMNRGAPSLTITVVPDSGTDALRGLSGHMTIDIRDGAHHYGFEYSLA